MSPTWRGVLGRLGVKPARPRLPLSGYSEGRVETPGVEILSDRELEELNAMLPWKCFTVDGRGRRFGQAARAGKRDTPQAVPDPRIVALDARFPLADASVLEIGCFEGVHTVALCARAREVVAVDARVENVVKTIVRTAFFGHSPRVFVCDVENEASTTTLPEVDVVHHVGVLYHLVDPVAHLGRVARLTRRVLMLDTHVAPSGEATDALVSSGRTYPVQRHGEFGRADVFSGMGTHSHWLPLPTLVEVLADSGLATVSIVEKRDERNGPRVLLHASRP